MQALWTVFIWSVSFHCASASPLVAVKLTPEIAFQEAELAHTVAHFASIPGASELLSGLQALPPSPRAYALFIRGDRLWARLAATAITSLRRTDSTSAIVLFTHDAMDADITHMLLHDAQVHIARLPESLTATADAFFAVRRCSSVLSCWMKFLALLLVPYKSVMFVDVDVIATQPLHRAFEQFEQRLSPGPYDIAGVPDMVASVRFPQGDCFNTGLFIVEPSLRFFNEFWAYAISEASIYPTQQNWPSADTWPLVTWPAWRKATWVRLPLYFNVFPHMFQAVIDSYAHFDGPATTLGPVHALHFVYPSKTLFGRLDCDVAAAEMRGGCRLCCEAFHAVGRLMQNKTAAAALALGLPARDD